MTMTTDRPEKTHDEPAEVGVLPDVIWRATPLQVTSCAACGRPMGGSRMLGAVPGVGGTTILLWVCAPECAELLPPVRREGTVTTCAGRGVGGQRV
jgi:hypothetical protein